MISVPNRTNWENYFKDIVIKNCDVRIYGYISGSYQVILDKNNITSFNYSSRNCYVCEEAPKIECDIEIADWNALSTEAKNILSTGGRWVRLKFVVNNVETTGYINLYIDKTIIKRDSFHASVSLLSVYDKGIQDYKYYSEYPYNYDDNILGQHKYAGSYQRTYRADSSPIFWTKTEAFQNFSLRYCCGFKISGTDFDWDTVTQVTFQPTVATGNFDVINAREYEYTIDDSGKENIDILGVQVTGKTVVELGLVSFDATSLSAQGDIFVNSPLYIDHYSVVYTSTGTSYNSQFNLTIEANRLHAFWNRNDYPIVTQGNYTFKAYGFGVVLMQPKDNISPYIETYALAEGTAELTATQNYCRSYFSNNKTIDMTCRIDPTIEPLDIIQMNLDIGTVNIAVEEVTINFNGGFTGSIKGRIAKLPSSISISNQKTDFEINEAFSFGGTVTCTSSYGDTSDVTSQCTFSGYDTTQTGTQTVTVSYTSGGITLTTTYQITVSAVKSPVLVDYELTTRDDYYFEIANPNNMAKTLIITYSGGTLTFNMAGKSQLIIDQTNASQLSDSVGEYIYRSLFDDVYCYFNEGGNNLLLLEANG